MTTLVTGVGLVGTAFARCALQRGEQVVFLDLQERPDYLHERLGPVAVDIPTVRADIRDQSAVLSRRNSIRRTTSPRNHVNSSMSTCANDRRIRSSSTAPLPTRITRSPRRDAISTCICRRTFLFRHPSIPVTRMRRRC